MIRFRILDCRHHRTMTTAVLLLAAMLVADSAPRERLWASEPSPVAGGLNHPSLISINSCAAAACHGGPTNARRGEWNKAYSVWQTNDPHSGAYATLLTERSRRIIELLVGSEASAVRASPASHSRPDPAEHYEKLLAEQGCVACHSTVQEDNWTAGLFRADGVNCQSCHGPAHKWETAHVKQDWAGESPSSESPSIKAAAGLNNLQDLAVRAEVCCRCHVGSPASDTHSKRDVNHDLIAAGHPRLSFELHAYFTYLTQRSAHWNVAAEQARADYPAQRWAAGQVASARASLKLLEHHATQPIWPEFAQHDCYACHHSLRWPSFRQRNAQPPLGSAAWGTWYWPRSGFVLVELEKAESGSAKPGLTEAMNRMLTDSQAAQQLSAATMAQLDRVFANHQAGAALVQLHEVVVREPRWNWDECTQWYLAASAFQQSMSQTPGNDTRAGEANLIQLRELLNVPPLDMPLTAPSEPPGAAETADESRPDKVQALVRALIVQFKNQKVPPE